MSRSTRIENLARLLRPRHIAVFGGGLAGKVIRESGRIGFGGDIWPVHPSRTELAGRRCFAHARDLPQAPDASFIAVPREATVDVVETLAALGAGGAVCYASGFAEIGDAGAALQERLVAAAGNLAVVGPNCYGVLNYLDGAALWPDAHGGTRVDEGVAIITQSGNVGISLTMQQRSVPIAYLVSVGNQAVLSVSDYVEALLTDARVKAIGVHVETVGDVERFSQVACAAWQARIPLVALKVGRSALGASAALSHTSALVGKDDLYDALFERMCIARVHSLAEFLETLKLLCVTGPLPGRRMVSISCSGGEAALIADTAEALGIEMPAFEVNQQARLRDVLGPLVHVANPLDYHTFIWGDPHGQRACFAAALAGSQDLTLKVLDYPSPSISDTADWDHTVDAFVDAVESAGTRAVLMSTLPENLPARVRDALAARGIAPLQGLEEGLRAVKAVMDIGAWHRQAHAPQPVIVIARDGEPTRVADGGHTRAFLHDRGVDQPRYEMCTLCDLVEKAEKIGYPLALKLDGVAHKSEIGAVALDIRDRDSLMRAAGRMSDPSRPFFMVESMVVGGVAELLVGVTYDPHFGMTLTMGAGGTLVELFGEQRTLLYPVTEAAIAGALDRLPVAKLLDGYRGRPRGDRRATIEAIMAIAEPDPNVVELEFNPLIILPEGEGAVAVDVLLRRSDAQKIAEAQRELEMGLDEEEENDDSE